MIVVVYVHWCITETAVIGGGDWVVVKAGQFRYPYSEKARKRWIGGRAL
jgi:hypothetical protein